MSAIIVSGALTGLLGLVFLPAAWVLGWLAWLFLSYLLLVARALAAPVFSSIEVGPVNPAFLWAYYALTALVIYLSRSRRLPRLAGSLKSAAKTTLVHTARLPRKWVIPSLAVAVALVWLIAASLPDDRLHVSFLDVGQGDAIFIQKGSRQVLVDGGPSPQALGLALGRAMPFWDRTIDLLILTHPDQDHLTGLVDVLRRYEVKHVLFSDSKDSSPLYKEWLGLVQGQQLARHSARAGEQIALGGAILKVVRAAEDSLEERSLVLRLALDKVDFLLTGDIDEAVERKLMSERKDISSTVFKVAHHGSSTSTGDAFLAASQPQVAVISVGADNKFGHPNQAVLDRLQTRLGEANVYRTDTRGTIEFITDGERLWVKTER